MIPPLHTPHTPSKEIPQGGEEGERGDGGDGGGGGEEAQTWLNQIFTTQRRPSIRHRQRDLNGFDDDNDSE